MTDIQERHPPTPVSRSCPAGAGLAARGVLAIAMLGIVPGALAQPRSAPGTDAWPLRPIRLLVPFAPGGPTDFIARVVAGRMGDRLGQPVVVDNRAGASGNIAIQTVARAVPDGHTLLFSSSNLVSNHLLSTPAPFDPVRDFAPISYVAVAPNIVFVHPSVPAKTAAELVALARAQPGKFSFGTPGTGTTPHVACEALRLAAGVDLQHVPYSGAAPVVSAVLGNQIPIGCTALPPTVSHVKTGALRAIAVTSARRSAVMPDVPTLVESGFPGVIADNLQGLLAPARTPATVVARLHAEVKAILAEPEVRDRLLAVGFDLHASTPEVFARIIREESERYAKIIRAAGIKSEQ
jgi:tripartite-type tricarboxylate transporter receptor subunit TctC